MNRDGIDVFIAISCKTRRRPLYTNSHRPSTSPPMSTSSRPRAARAPRSLSEAGKRFPKSFLVLLIRCLPQVDSSAPLVSTGVSRRLDFDDLVGLDDV